MQKLVSKPTFCSHSQMSSFRSMSYSPIPLNSREFSSNSIFFVASRSLKLVITDSSTQFVIAKCFACILVKSSAPMLICVKSLEFFPQRWKFQNLIGNTLAKPRFEPSSVEFIMKVLSIYLKNRSYRSQILWICGRTLRLNSENFCSTLFGLISAIVFSVRISFLVCRIRFFFLSFSKVACFHISFTK